MKVRVDPAKCNGYALCNRLAPEIFKLDEWGYAFADGGEVDPDYEDRVREAVKVCPQNAILIEE
ncbi:MAG TPA: ferredoxin [Arthrobacter sp.]|jgi:ferredoxin|nr:ferredoxin [Arthrobacter sp.]